MQYKVVWTIDIEANSPQEAAKEALLIQRDSGSEATMFEVRNPDTNKLIENVDLGLFMTLYPNIEELIENNTHKDIVNALLRFDSSINSDVFYDDNNIPLEINTLELLEIYVDLDDFEEYLSNE